MGHLSLFWHSLMFTLGVMGLGMTGATIAVGFSLFVSRDLTGWGYTKGLVCMVVVATVSVATTVMGLDGLIDFVTRM